MQTTSTDRSEPTWIMLAVARDGDVAERWVDALEAAAIDVEVRIDDAIALTNGSSLWPSASPRGYRLFAYPIFVPADAREAAATVLVDKGWDGGHGQTTPGMSLRMMLQGAFAAILAGGVVAAALLLSGR